MSLISKLFGAKTTPSVSAAPGPVESYHGYTIRPTPVAASGGYRIGAVIQRNGLTHNLVRADIVTGLDEARALSVAKARQVIDQQGDSIFR